MMKPMPRLGSILGRCALSMSASFECNVLFNMHRTLDTRRAARVCVCIYIYTQTLPPKQTFGLSTSVARFDPLHENHFRLVLCVGTSAVSTSRLKVHLRHNMLGDFLSCRDFLSEKDRERARFALPPPGVHGRP